MSSASVCSALTYFAQSRQHGKGRAANNALAFAGPRFAERQPDRTAREDRFDARAQSSCPSSSRPSSSDSRLGPHQHLDGHQPAGALAAERRRGVVAERPLGHGAGSSTTSSTTVSGVWPPARLCRGRQQAVPLRGLNSAACPSPPHPVRTAPHAQNSSPRMPVPATPPNAPQSPSRQVPKPSPNPPHPAPKAKCGNCCSGSWRNPCPRPNVRRCLEPWNCHWPARNPVPFFVNGICRSSKRQAGRARRQIRPNLLELSDGRVKLQRASRKTRNASIPYLDDARFEFRTK